MKYFINGFKHLYDAFKRADTDNHYEFLFPKSTRFDYISNYRLLKKWDKEGKLKDFDVIHLNCWETILTYNPRKKLPHQITIAEAHGFFVGVNFMATIREQPIQTRIPNFVLKLAADKKMQNKIRQFDFFYYSTPNMKEHAEKIRKDALWLPNPIDTKIFTPNGDKVELEGEPAVFLPTRLHAFKNPLFGIKIFNKIKEKYPKAKLHMIRYGTGADPLFNAFRKIVDEKDVVYHDRMPREELTKYYRSADLVLGQFNPKLANFSMVEIEAMGCGAPIVTLDIYEIKEEFENPEKLEELAFRLLEDSSFKKRFINRNLKYVLDVHSDAAVTKKNLKYIKNLRK